jgi:hypothetical protein
MPASGALSAGRTISLRSTVAFVSPPYHPRSQMPSATGRFPRQEKRCRIKQPIFDPASGNTTHSPLYGTFTGYRKPMTVRQAKKRGRVGRSWRKCESRLPKERSRRRDGGGLQNPSPEPLVYLPNVVCSVQKDKIEIEFHRAFTPLILRAFPALGVCRSCAEV